MKRFFRGLLVSCGVLFSIHDLYSQCILPSFDLPTVTCINSTVSLKLEQEYDSVIWRLCPSELAAPPAIAEIGNSLAFRAAFAFDHVRVADDNYGFAIRNNTEFYFLDFNSDFSGFDEITRYAELGAANFSAPRDLHIDFVEDKWLGFVANTVNFSISKLDFGNDILSVPVSEQLVVPENITDIFSVGGGHNDDNYILFAGSEISNQIFVLEFQSGVAVMPTVVDTLEIGSLSQVTGIEIFKDCNLWYALVTSEQDGEVYLLEFGDDLLNTPIQHNLDIPVELDRPTRGVFQRDLDQIFAFVQNVDGTIFRFDFGNHLTNIFTTDDFNLSGGSFYAMNIIEKDDDSFLLLSLDSQVGFQNMYSLQFQNSCSIGNLTGNDVVTSFDSIGDKQVGVSVYNFAEQNVGFLSKAVTVSSDVAPTISYTSQNICQSSPIQFTSESTSSGLTYNWDFGDATISVDENPSHTYASAGEYEVTLEVSDGTCENFTRQTIIIYDEPIPSFSSPPGLVCTNQQLTILNTTTGDFGGNETWEWQIDDVSVSNDRDLDLSFVSGGMKSVKLISSIPGCSVEFVQNIEVLEGPNPSFLANNVCIGSTVEFINSTVGEVSSYLWDFDNGFTSNLENPNFEFTDPGTYNVSLTVENNAGCVTSFQNSVIVHSSPETLFTNDLSCELNLTQFNDFTTVAGANISQWAWDFGDPASDSNTSLDQNASHIFSGAGSFEVKLVTTSIFGCKDSLAQTVNVLESPIADFSFDKACLGESIELQNTSTPVNGESITSFEWDIAGTFSNQENPNTVFNTVDDFEVSLFVTSENLCLGSVSKTIRIAEPPDLSIGMGAACDNEPVKFFDLSPTNGDPISTWEWNFNNQGSASDSVAFFDFESAGSFDVGLNVITENGCEFSVQQEVTVNQAPQAIFDMSVTFGAPPLVVDFENNSQGAIDFQWNFDGENQSNEVNPSFIYNELGEYLPELVATSDAGCMDTVSQQLSVLIPELELQLLSLIIPEDQNQPIVVSLRNNGSLILNQIKALIDLGDEVILEEEINAQIQPGEIINYPLELKIRDRRINYLCIEIVSEVEGISEQNSNDNVLCQNFFDDLIATDAYPNPAANFINIDFVSEENTELDIRILNSLGGLVKGINLGVPIGRQSLRIDLTQLRQGLYFIHIPQLSSIQRFNIRR